MSDAGSEWYAFHVAERRRSELTIKFIDVSVKLSRLMKYVAGEREAGKYRYFHGRLATSIASA